MKNDEKDLNIIRKKFDVAVQGWKHIHKEATEDTLFFSGKQWSDIDVGIRQARKQPILTLNQLPQYVDQVLGNQQYAKKSIQVTPTRSGTEKKYKNRAGTKEYTLAEVFDGIINQIEYDSKATDHYLHAFATMLQGGIGWLRIYTKYEEDSFDQKIVISSIQNPLLVFCDPFSMELNYADMRYAFLATRMNRDEFRDLYPDAKEDTFFPGFSVDYDSVLVTEYFYKNLKKRELLELTDGRIVYKDQFEPVEDELKGLGIGINRSRKVDGYEVKWMKITANDILEEPRVWAGKRIPLIPVLGKPIIVDGKIYYRGMIHNAIESQKLFNWWTSVAAQVASGSTKSPFIVDIESIEPFRDIWDTANEISLPYLPFVAKPGVPAPIRQPATPMPSTELHLAELGRGSIENAIGLYPSNLGMPSNETSGLAIQARQQRGDIGQFAYVNNFMSSLQLLGEHLVDIIPKIYDGTRTIPIRLSSLKEDDIQINQIVKDQETGKDVLLNDLSIGKFNITVATGPDYQTQKQQATQELLTLIQTAPEITAKIVDIIALNQDWPGAKDISTRLKKLLPPGVLTPEELEEAGIQTPEPSPLDIANLQKMQIEIAKLQAETEKIKMETQQGLQNPAENKEQIKQIVAESLAEFFTQAQQGQSQLQQQQQPNL